MSIFLSLCFSACRTPPSTAACATWTSATTSTPPLIELRPEAAQGLIPVLLAVLLLGMFAVGVLGWVAGRLTRHNHRAAASDLEQGSPPSPSPASEVMAMSSYRPRR